MVPFHVLVTDPNPWSTSSRHRKDTCENGHFRRRPYPVITPVPTVLDTRTNVVTTTVSTHGLVVGVPQVVPPEYDRRHHTSLHTRMCVITPSSLLQTNTHG